MLKIMAWLVVVLAAVEARAGGPAFAVERGHKVPKGIAVPGRSLEVLEWRDAKGNNVVVFSFRESIAKGRGYDGGNRESVMLYVSHFVLGKKPRLVRRVTDQLKACDWEATANFMRVGEQNDVTDLDGDGIAELTIAYQLGCRSDISPITVKVLVLEHGEKYAIRGTSKIEAVDCGCPQGVGGDQQVDPQLQKVPAFLAHAQKVWSKAVIDPLSQPDRTRDTAKLFSVLHDVDYIKALLDRGADVNGLDVDGRTVLHAALQTRSYASETQSLASVKVLVEHGANVNATDWLGRTALHMIANTRSPAIIQFLLEHGANVNTTDQLGRTPLHLATVTRSPAIVQLLLNHGANVSATDTDGRTALHEAADYNHGLNRVDTGIAAVLLDKGADPLARDRSGVTPVHIAAECQVRVLELLLDRGADINVLDEYGWTPMHFTIKWQNEATLELLLQRKADPSLRTQKNRRQQMKGPEYKAGMTAYEMAVQTYQTYGSEPQKSRTLPVFRRHDIPARDGK